MAKFKVGYLYKGCDTYGTLEIIKVTKIFNDHGVRADFIVKAAYRNNRPLSFGIGSDYSKRLKLIGNLTSHKISRFYK